MVEGWERVWGGVPAKAAPVPARGDWEGSRSRGNRGHRWPHFLQYKPGFLRFLLGPSPGGERGGAWPPTPAMGRAGGGLARPQPGQDGWGAGSRGSFRSAARPSIPGGEASAVPLTWGSSAQTTKPPRAPQHRRGPSAGAAGRELPPPVEEAR